MAEIDGDPAGDSARPHRLAMPVSVVVLAIVLATVSIGLLRNALHGSPAGPAEPAVAASPAPPAPSGTAPMDQTAFMCIEQTNNPHCARYVSDLARRSPLDGSQRAAADTGRVRIEAAFPPDREGPCEYDETGEFCSMEILPPTITQVRLALRRAGIAGAVLRTARADDPAPVGSVLLAVPAGPACLLAYDDGDGLQQWTAGQLPDGTCLPR
ncbi:hypothetical protein ACQP2Y_13100 [Actinoplanes sp. CA-051413]|uniref:hypothetical protein n=1 Tax=Actinoplanes sp. CA-051413 TaxID=3239899 RepID=UPI003D97958F